jgi:hypothetical protein
VELEITPEPTPDERRAVELALAAELAAAERIAATRSAWHEQGVRENTASDDAD